MTKTLVSRFDKHQIAALPKASFEGRIVVILNEKEAEKAVDYLLSQPLLGFDTETRPSFTKGRRYKVALLQVSARDICFLFRLNHIGIPDAILRLLTDDKVKKVGLSWQDDLNSLYRRKKFQCAPFVELQTYAKEIGIEDMSLQKLYANVFGQKISKSQQLSNWENDVLSEAQKAYAAMDAWACLQLYEELHRLRLTGDYELEVIPEPDPPIRMPKAAAEDKPKVKKQSTRRNSNKSKTKKKTNVQKTIPQAG